MKEIQKSKKKKNYPPYEFFIGFTQKNLIRTVFVNFSLRNVLQAISKQSGKEYKHYH